MLSLTRTLVAFPCRAPHGLPRRSVPFVGVIRSNSDNGNNVVSTSSGNGESMESLASTPRGAPPQPDTMGIRFKRGSRKRRKQEQEVSDKTALKQASSAPKEWDSMTLSEKLVSLYVGEKGLLFWLNKFAYASIFIVIGGWIVFRFVGPALNLYQLDTPPLSPTSIFK